MVARLFKAAGVRFLLTCPFEKKHFYFYFYIFRQYLVNIYQYLSNICRYWSMYCTYLLYGTAYSTVLRFHAFSMSVSLTTSKKATDMKQRDSDELPSIPATSAVLLEHHGGRAGSVPGQGTVLLTAPVPHGETRQTEDHSHMDQVQDISRGEPTLGKSLYVRGRAPERWRS